MEECHWTKFFNLFHIFTKLHVSSVSLLFPNLCPVEIRLHPQSLRHFAFTTFSVSLTNLTSILHQSHDCRSIISRIILTPTPLWPHKHTDLGAHKFTHSPSLWHQPRLAITTCAWSWSLCGINPVTPNQSLPIELFNYYLSTSYTCQPTK